MYHCYVQKNFRKEAQAIIEIANGIIEEYEDQGFILTLRQLYYQFVARDIIPNRQAWYDKLGNIINDARLAGYVSWGALEDRTRNIKQRAHWGSIEAILEATARSYTIDRWANQAYHVEVWIEKDALIGVIEDVCNKYDVAHFSCRGYVSASEMYKAGERMQRALQQGKTPIVMHLGDHDPSGIDMTFDIWKRLNMFVGFDYKEMQKIPPASTSHITEFDFFNDEGVTVRRLGLNIDQIEKYSPPPNPAKVTDSRAKTYIAAHSTTSWELDSLSPKVLSGLISNEIMDLINQEKWEIKKDEEYSGQDKIRDLITKAREI